MAAPFSLLEMYCQAVLRRMGPDLAGSSIVERLPEIAEEIWRQWRRGGVLEHQQVELVALARIAPESLRWKVQEAVLAFAGERPASLQRALRRLLMQLPAALRRCLRRPADPEGRSVPAGWSLEGPEDLLRMLPERQSRFQVGDRPLPGIDWELVELLGSGGFGEVWKARNPHFDAVPPVALKFCLDAAAQDRLLRHEAAVLNQVMRQGKHPGIVSLLHTYLSADPPCLEYEFVPGGTLADVIEDWQRQTATAGAMDRVERMILELARILAHAHHLNPPIVHRDLKPSNILVRQARPGQLSLHVTDFGIGGMAANTCRAPSQRGRPEGTRDGPLLVSILRGAHTPLYASPQQAEGAAPDPRDDVHAIGVIWYQLAMGSLSAGRPNGAGWARRLAERGMAGAALDLLGACVADEARDRPVDAGVLAVRLAALQGPVRNPVQKPTVLVRAPRRAAPSHLPKRLTNSIDMKMVLIPAGTFLQGSPQEEPHRSEDEGPGGRVTITRSFYLGVYPVTQAEFQAVMGTNPAHFSGGNGGGLRHPVEQVSWDEAVEFCQQLTERREERSVGCVYRLPTEAEWEYACRANTTTPFSCGASLDATQANFDCSHPYGPAKASHPLERTTKVGSYPANAYGLYDMHGNLWEWCADWYEADAYANQPDKDPSGPARGTWRVLRGGSWNNSGHLCRSTRRNKYPPGFLSDTIGFRVVLAKD